VRAEPFNFDKPGALADALRGVDSLVNTYWVRFDHKLFTFADAIRNTRTLFTAARDAGVRRIVHVSITHPDAQSDLPYFRGKAELEEALRALGVPWCILRPTVLFGKEDVFINNIAWALRRMPVFGVFGDGQYRMQPIHVDDLALAAAGAATNPEGGDRVIEAIGPETFTYRGMVEMIARELGLRRVIMEMPPPLAYAGCSALGKLVGDVIITRDEIRGLMEGRLCVEAPPLGLTRLTDWVRAHRDTLGRRYTSELSRRTDRVSEYGSN
jgi:NADH dehydrogenase